MATKTQTRTDKTESVWTTIERIAKQEFNVDTLEERKSDSLDFYEAHVLTIKRALEEAYLAGVKAGRAEAKRELEG